MKFLKIIGVMVPLFLTSCLEKETSSGSCAIDVRLIETNDLEEDRPYSILHKAGQGIVLYEDLTITAIMFKIKSGPVRVKVYVFQGNPPSNFTVSPGEVNFEVTTGTFWPEHGETWFELPTPVTLRGEDYGVGYTIVIEPQDGSIFLDYGSRSANALIRTNFRDLTNTYWSIPTDTHGVSIGIAGQTSRCDSRYAN